MWKKFYDALAQDAALADELEHASLPRPLHSPQKRASKITTENQTELSDADLDNVNGGAIKVKRHRLWDDFLG